jgi:glycine oxidase
MTARITDSGIRLPEIAQVRNPRLVAALRNAIVANGGTLHTQCAAHDATADGGRVARVHTACGTFSADHFVIATGAWAGLGLPGMEGVPNVRPIRGQMLLFKLAPGALDSIVYSKGLYLIPRKDGHVLVGSTVEDVGFDKSTDAATATSLHAAASALCPMLEPIQPVMHWAGLRPGSPDNIPIIDRHPDYENVYINAGHFRYGVTLAPASAELLVDLMEGHTPALDPHPYRWAAAVGRAWS